MPLGQFPQQRIAQFSRALFPILLAINLGWSPSTDSLRWNVQSSCQRLISWEDHTTLEFWQEFARDKYPSTQKWVIPSLISALEEMEGDPEYWGMFQEIWKKYRHESPKWIQDVNTWLLSKLQDNFWEILYTLLTSKDIPKPIRDALIKSIIIECTRQSA